MLQTLLLKHLNKLTLQTKIQTQISIQHFMVTDKSELSSLSQNTRIHKSIQRTKYTQSNALHPQLDRNILENNTATSMLYQHFDNIIVYIISRKLHQT